MHSLRTPIADDAAVYKETAVSNTTQLGKTTPDVPDKTSDIPLTPKPQNPYRKLGPPGDTASPFPMVPTTVDSRIRFQVREAEKHIKQCTMQAMEMIEISTATTLERVARQESKLAKIRKQSLMEKLERVQIQLTETTIAAMDQKVKEAVQHDRTNSPSVDYILNKQTDRLHMDIEEFLQKLTSEATTKYKNQIEDFYESNFTKLTSDLDSFATHAKLIQEELL